MRASLARLCLVPLTGLLLTLCGCVELLILSAIGAPDSGVAGATTQSSNVTGPIISAVQLDPELEATAGAKVIAAADFDADGLVDFVSGSDENQPIQLHLRTGAAVDFDTFTIAGGAPVARMTDLAVADFDGDDRLDVAVLVNDTGFVPVTGASIRGAVVILFAPDDVTDALSWQPVTLTASFVLPGDETGLSAFAIGDFDGAAGADVLLASNEADNVITLRLFLNPGGVAARTGGNWVETTNPVEQDVNAVTDVQIADIDGDGDLDAVAAFPTGKSFNIRWMQNPLVESGAAAARNGSWTRNFVGQQGQIDPEAAGGDAVAMGDVDGDGDVDAAVAHAGFGLVQWFENPGESVVAQQTFPWNVYILGTAASGVDIDQMRLVDLDLDGRLDCFATGSGRIFAFEAGANVRAIWTRVSILSTDPIADIGKSAFLDVNGDGLLDVVSPLDRPGLTQDQFLIFLRLTP